MPYAEEGLQHFGTQDLIVLSPSSFLNLNFEVPAPAMTTNIIITLCALLLFAYVFDLTAAKTRVPAVILLLLLGWMAQQLAIWAHVPLPDLNEALPVLGTVGLILIVLEGSLELEIDQSKLGLITKAVLGSFLSLIVMTGLLAWAFYFWGHYSIMNSLVNAVPLCIISSAIAIPSVRNLAMQHREFVIYESSFSDIVGVLLFNFLALNKHIDVYSFTEFGIQLLVMILISVVATVGLSQLLSRSNHHIKFMPIILMVILIYAVSKIYHLPGLLFIMFFGLMLSNVNRLKELSWMRHFKPEVLQREVHKFRELTVEAAFLIRALFFIVFGFLIETAEVLNANTLIWALAITAGIFTIRWLQLKLSGLALQPLLFVAPRGLITILLFLSVAPDQLIPLVNKSLIIQVMLLSALVMMLGLLVHKSDKKQVDNK